MLNTLICTPQYLAVTEKSYTFAPLLDQEPVSNRRRDGRVVDYNGLENRRAERHRGFESLSLRQEWRNELITNSYVTLLFYVDKYLRHIRTGYWTNVFYSLEWRAEKMLTMQSSMKIQNGNE